MGTNIQSRSPLWYATAAVLLLLALLLVGYLVLLIRIQTASPAIERDYAAEINEPFELFGADESAEPVFEAISGISMLMQDLKGRDERVELSRQRLGDLPEGSRERELAAVLVERIAAGPAFALMDDDSGFSYALGGFPDYHTWPGVRAGYEQVPELRELIAIAVNRPSIGSPLHAKRLEPGTPLVQAQRIDNLGTIREMGRVLKTEAGFAYDSGDPDRLVAAFELQAKLHDLTCQLPFNLVFLVADAIQEWTLGQINWVLHTDRDFLTADHLTELNTLITPSSYAYQLETERMLHEDAAQRSWSASGLYLGVNWDENEPPTLLETMLSPVTHLRTVSKENHEAAIETNFSIFEQPLSEGLWTVTPDDIETQRSLPLFEFLTPEPNYFYGTHARARTRVEATRALIACERHRLAYGSYPDTLESLVPEFLPERPIDPFTGDPLGYLIEDDAITLYSAGKDRIDDGGSHDSTAEFWTVTPAPDAEHGDWVLFPPQPR